MKYVMLGLLLSAICTVASADELVIPLGSENRACKEQHCPERSMRMAEVKKRFGEPQTTKPPIGDPAISCWHYPGFSVYFEGNNVIHVVAER